MNPAPTLLNDWVTNQGFWIFIGFSVFAVIVWVATEFLKRWHASSVNLDRVLEEGPPSKECVLEVCTRPGIIPVHTTQGIRFVCQQHSGVVGNWAGKDVYDQELDPATDLGQWNQETR